MPKASGQTGPKSAAGKSRSSQNARKHGLSATKPPLMASESRTEYESIYRQLVAEYAPQGPLEEFCCCAIGMSMLKQHRIWRSEAAAFELAEFLDSKALPAEPQPLLSSGLEEERKILVELLDRLDTEVWQGEDAYQSSDDAKQHLEELEDGEEPLSWALSAAMTATDTTHLLTDLIQIYPPSQLPEQVSDRAYSADVVVENRAAKRRMKTARHPYGLMEETLTRLKLLVAVFDEEESDEDQQMIERWSEMATSAVNELQSSATSRLAEIAALEKSTRAAIAAEAKRKARLNSLQNQGIPEQIELISRYQTATSRELHQAIDRLNSLQDRRNML